MDSIIAKEEHVAHYVLYLQLGNNYIIEPYSSFSISGVLKLTTKSKGCKTNVKFSDQKSLPLVYSHAYNLAVSCLFFRQT